MKESIIQSNPISTIDELIAELNRFKTGNGSTNYINMMISGEKGLSQTDSQQIHIELIKETLSDDSEVFNIAIIGNEDSQ